MKENKKNRNVVSVHDVLSEYSNTFLSAEERQVLVNEAINEAYRKSDDPNIREIRDKLSKHSGIRHLGDGSAVELLGKLGIWLNAVDEEVSELYTPQNGCIL